MLLRILDSVRDELSVAILENLLPDSWDIDMGDGTIPLRKSLREKCYNLIAPKAAKASLSFLVRDDGIRNLSERGRFRGAKHCLFDPKSPLRKEKLREEFLALIRSGLNDHTVYTNVREYLQMLARGLQLGTEIDFVGSEKLAELLQDAKFLSSLWKTATSREIQYRMQGSFIKARQDLIDAGALQDSLPLTDELNARILEEESRKTATAALSSTESDLLESA